MNVQFVKTEVFPYGTAPSDEKEALKVVELCGRTAYKSEDRITEDSAKSFVLMLKGHGHLSVLEHSNIVLKIGVDPKVRSAAAAPSLGELESSLAKIFKVRNAYHRIYSPLDGPDPRALFVAGNFRAWIETLEYLQTQDREAANFFSRHLNRYYPNLFESGEPSPALSLYSVSPASRDEQLNLLKEDSQSDLPVFIFKIVCDRGITHEVVRHRVLSFTQESTRYVNYKNRGMTLILPEELEPFYDADKGELTGGDPLVRLWLDRGEALFEWYRDDVARGLRPEIARDILPNLLKSEIFVSGRWSGWKHFITLRASKAAHPRIRFLAREVRSWFNSIGLHCD